MNSDVNRQPAQATGLVKDPVCGMDVDPRQTAFTVEHDGERGLPLFRSLPGPGSRPTQPASPSARTTPPGTPHVGPRPPTAT